MQGSILCLTAAMVIFQSDGACRTSNNTLQLCAPPLICTWPSTACAATKTPFHETPKKCSGEQTASQSGPLRKQFKTCKLFKGILQIEAANFLPLPCFPENLCSWCAFISGGSEQGMKINHMTSAKLHSTPTLDSQQQFDASFGKAYH